MAERHKSKYKAPKDLEKSQKIKTRKDLKDYTADDKTGALNPYSTKQKQTNVLRKTDKEMVDDGKYDVKYNSDDRLYKDLEDGEYDAKHAAKILKKRQDKEEKDVADVLKDKIENLTREQKERLVREYVRRKIVKVILEQEEKTEDKPEEATPEAPAAETPQEPAAEQPPAEGGEAPAGEEAPEGEDAAISAPAPSSAAAPPPPSSSPTTSTPAVTTPTTPEQPAASTETKPEVAPETKEALAVDQFVNYLKKQESVLGKLKKALIAVNLSLKDVEPEDKVNFYKMLKLAASRQLDTSASKTK